MNLGQQKQNINMKQLEKCSTPYCRNTRVKGRKFCSNCHAKQWKKNHPEAYFYNYWKQNAKRRGKIFEVTFEQFQQFCKDNNFMELKGRFSENASIDRIRSWEGYYYENLQVLSVGGNVRKQRSEENCPF